MLKNTLRSQNDQKNTTHDLINIYLTLFGMIQIKMTLKNLQ